MATKKTDDSDISLPFAALQLLAPPLRLVSAAVWKVLKQRDVMQYGVLEEFVTSACETIPGLLTFRHQGKLTLGLRARLILELCRTQPDAEVIAPHLERIRAPATSSSVKKDVKITKTVKNFHCFIHTMLTDPAERELFFKEQFPVDYGPKFDQELEKLLWEFLIRLDQLLPVPSLAQTVSWLSESPVVLEECAQSATQPQLLNVLLQHQTCLGHLEAAASLPPNMGDSILASLSLLPSGRVASDHLPGVDEPSGERWNGSQPREASAFVTPVIGLIFNEDVPVMISARKRTQRADEVMDERPDSSENPKFTSVKRRGKANEGGAMEARGRVEIRTEDDTEEGGASGRKRRAIESEEDEAEGARGEGWSQDPLTACVSKHSVRKLHLPEDPSLRSVYASCLSGQPRVVVEKLSLVSAGSSSPSGGGGAAGGGRGSSFYKKQDNHRRKTTECKQTRLHESSECPGLDNKENQPVLSSVSSPSSQQRHNSETTAVRGDGDEYVADSEDEGTKNFKGRLFVKRYYKTKHGTYVPTLREFWKPGVTRRHMLSAGSKRR
ncbi:TERF1-interacting nuclear factor 2 [Kryptolebias marmoratus]|uniref:TERF1 (TRF1)-interacting nuclear factor 2 n=1 Tax=Kryptolebias marmoratus TaxID=37003 RepID=A0A3Q3AIM2_KRYMA|nr:TERF1-interacting nuclear factor 2 [Kryptolebias marmoratus]